MQKRRLEAWLEVLAWNAAHEVGTAVIYASVVQRLGPHVCYTRCVAVVLPGCVPGVWITGQICAVRLDRVQLAAAIAPRPRPRPLIRATHAFGLFLPENPRVARNGPLRQMMYG